MKIGYRLALEVARAVLAVLTGRDKVIRAGMAVKLESRPGDMA